MSIEQNVSSVRQKYFILIKKWKVIDDGISVLMQVI